MKLSGVNALKVIDTDPLIKRAINLSCKAQFGYDDPKIAETDFQESIQVLKQHLTLSMEYTEVVYERLSVHKDNIPSRMGRGKGKDKEYGDPIETWTLLEILSGYGRASKDPLIGRSFSLP